MRPKISGLVKKLKNRIISEQLNLFLRDEAIGGKLIIAAAAVSLVIANSAWSTAFENLWQAHLTIGLGNFDLSMDLRHWINEGLMAFFFLVVGLEIKRELVRGELRDRQKFMLPIGAAVGGMILPALIYIVFNLNGPGEAGWGIPMATDIAFAIAVLSLLGSRVPSGLKIFLLSLAIADDIGAITVIALFYSEVINIWYLLASLAMVGMIWVFRKELQVHVFIVLALGAALWLTTHHSGVHASIVGAVMGMLAPVGSSDSRKTAAERMERLFLPFTTFFVLPVFALANAGFEITRGVLDDNQAVSMGIILGLLLGKPVGILMSSWLLVKFKIARLPERVNWRHVAGIGLIAGIGFTVSIFITELAFSGNPSLISTAKASIFVASILAAITGSLVLSAQKPRL